MELPELPGLCHAASRPSARPQRGKSLSTILIKIKIDKLSSFIKTGGWYWWIYCFFNSNDPGLAVDPASFFLIRLSPAAMPRLPSRPIAVIRIGCFHLNWCVYLFISNTSFMVKHFGQKYTSCFRYKADSRSSSPDRVTLPFFIHSTRSNN